MGSYEDVAFTFSPAEITPSAVADDLREFLDTPLDELPDVDWPWNREQAREYDFDRGALQIEVDEEYEQTYLFGRTHNTVYQQAWREWVVNGGIGDGILAIILHHEVDYWGWGWAYEWDQTAGEYTPAMGTRDDEPSHVDGEKCGFGAIAAYRIYNELDVRPARCRSHLIRWRESDWDDTGFIPDFYFESRDDPPDPRE